MHYLLIFLIIIKGKNIIINFQISYTNKIIILIYPLATTYYLFIYSLK